MAIPSLINELIGTVDGANAIFSTPQPFVANTTRLFLNGQLLVDGWSEEAPDRLHLSSPPQVGDVVAAFYRVQS